MIIAIAIMLGGIILSIAGFIALVILTAVALALAAALVVQIVQSHLSPAAKTAWIAAAILLPLISTALWYFFAPRTAPTEEERVIASNFFAEIGQPI